MSDVQSRSRPATYGARAGFNSDLFRRACARKGATTADERADLIGVTQKMAYLYEYGHIVPNVLRAMHIADTLDLQVSDLWTAPEPERQAA